jgi:hypothetical protein
MTEGHDRPTPERITMALDMHALYGPEVDEALGGREPMVDEWEAGTLVPTVEQIQLLAELTDHPVDWFYLPAPPRFTGGFMCIRSGKGKGCYPLDDMAGSKVGRPTQHALF